MKSQSRKTTQPWNLHREERGVFFFPSVVFLSWKMKLYLCQPGFFFFFFFFLGGGGGIKKEKGHGHCVEAHREQGHSGPVSKFWSAVVGRRGVGRCCHQAGSDLPLPYAVITCRPATESAAEGSIWLQQPSACVLDTVSAPLGLDRPPCNSVFLFSFAPNSLLSSICPFTFISLAVFMVSTTKATSY